MRSKSRTIKGPINSVKDLPEWNFDGSSCEMATTEDSEVIMKPVAYFKDPFRGGDNLLVLTETFRWTDDTHSALRPANTNYRHFASPIFEKVEEEKTWFGIE